MRYCRELEGEVDSFVELAWLHEDQIEQLNEKTEGQLSKRYAIFSEFRLNI